MKNFMPKSTKYINTKDVVRLSGLTTNEVLNLAKTSVLPAHKTRRGHWRYNVDAVEKYFGIKINKPEEETKPTKPAAKSLPQIESDITYIEDEEHTTQVFRRMTEVKHSLKIATANLKNFNVLVDGDNGTKKIRLCDFFMSLVKRGVNVQIVCMKPLVFFLYAREHCPQLLENPLFELQLNEQNHMKIFIFDDECAYFGSANITGAAIGKRSVKKRNYEVGVLVWGEMMEKPFEHFERAWNDLDSIKHTWKRFAAEAKKKRRNKGTNSDV